MRPSDFLTNKTLSCIWVPLPVDWVILHWYTCGADGRSLARCTVTWSPNFLGWVDYHISLAMGLRPRARFARGWSSASIKYVPGTSKPQRNITCLPRPDINYIMSHHNVRFHGKSAFQSTSVTKGWKGPFLITVHLKKIVKTKSRKVSVRSQSGQEKNKRNRS